MGNRFPARTIPVQRMDDAGGEQLAGCPIAIRDAGRQVVDEPLVQRLGAHCQRLTIGIEQCRCGDAVHIEKHQLFPRRGRHGRIAGGSQGQDAVALDVEHLDWKAWAVQCPRWLVHLHHHQGGRRRWSQLQTPDEIGQLSFAAMDQGQDDHASTSRATAWMQAAARWAPWPSLTRVQRLESS